MDSEREREHLKRQLENRGISDRRVLEAIGSVPRHRFVPPESRSQAYDDNALPIGSGQTISQPYMVALMTQELCLSGDERVLEIGTGSGYQAAVLAVLAREVVTIERFPELSQEAQSVLGEIGYENIEFRVGDGTLGCPDRAPYDGIIVTAGAPDVPAPLYKQLNEGGRLIIPIGDDFQQMLQVIEKRGGRPVTTDVCACRFVKLIGDAGWPE